MSSNQLDRCVRCHKSFHADDLWDGMCPKCASEITWEEIVEEEEQSDGTD